MSEYRLVLNSLKPSTGSNKINADPQDYHPGRGVYRSSSRNAQRLARTEINMAYRTAEQKRWEKFDFVVGFEVKTTQNGKHVTDICDDLAGKYPKTFVFKGWHPQCMCYCIPILKTEDEFWLLDEDAKSVNEVTDVPKGFEKWVEANAGRIKKAEANGTAPYFIADNREVVKGILEKKKHREEEQARIEANRQEYERLKADPNYTGVEFNSKNGGLKATHVEHNFDGDKGWYEEHVQTTGFQNGHSIILEKEIHTIQNKRNVEGLFDGQSFEIAGAETGIANNIRNALKHCASKPGCKVAVVFFPDENKVDMAKIRDGLKKYFGLKCDPNQFKDFDHIYFMTSNRIIYHQKKQGD